MAWGWRRFYFSFCFPFGLDLARGARAYVGVLDVEAMHLRDKGSGVLLGELRGGPALLVGAIDDLIVHVGEVLGKGRTRGAIRSMKVNSALTTTFARRVGHP